MKIVVDGYEANVSQRLGSSQVAFELLKGLERIDRVNEYTILLPAPPLLDLPRTRADWNYKILKPKRLWTQIALPLYLYTGIVKPDLIFSPTHYLPRFVPSKVKKVITIFDLSFLHFPGMFTKGDLWKLQNWTKFSAKNANHIITISASSKQDIVEQYGVDKDKITVAYPGYDEDKFKIQNVFQTAFGRTKFKVEETLKKFKIEGEYIIYIGTVQPRKNLVRLMEAVAGIKGLKLVVVGKTSGLGRQGWKFDEILQTPKRLGIDDRVIFTGFVPVGELPYLLSGAFAFILPSLYEGFGLPVLEAMASGVPVICSNVSSLPEVCGDAGLLIDPYSVAQIEQAIRTILNDKKLRQRKIKEGLVQVKKFSWDKMARTVLKVFEKTESRTLKVSS